MLIVICTKLENCNINKDCGRATDTKTFAKTYKWGKMKFWEGGLIGSQSILNT